MATILARLHETALTGAPDGDLLRRFTSGGGAEAEAAFAVLVRRHGPAMFRICRSVLRHRDDAEDAFQATFLVLATKARSLAPRTTLGPWLWEVARRVSVRARESAARRRAHEMKAAKGRAEAQSAGAAVPELSTAVLQAVSRLPKRYRAPVVLCDLEGLTYQQAGDRLGVSHAAVRNRLARARVLLRATLRRLGFASVGAAMPGVAQAVPRTLVSATARAAVAVAAGTADGAVPKAILELMSGGFIVSKLKTVSVSAVAAAVLIAGAVGLCAQSPFPAPQVPASGEDALLNEQTTVLFAQKQLAGVEDAAERVLKLAQEAKERQAAGDTEGVLRLLRQLDDASWAWQGVARKQQRAGKETAKAPTSTAQAYRQMFKSAAKNPSPFWPQAINEARQPAARGDVETRLQELEQKLDRLLKALEGQKTERKEKP